MVDTKTSSMYMYNMCIICISILFSIPLPPYTDTEYASSRLCLACCCQSSPAQKRTQLFHTFTFGKPITIIHSCVLLNGHTHILKMANIKWKYSRNNEAVKILFREYYEHPNTSDSHLIQISQIIEYFCNKSNNAVNT